MNKTEKYDIAGYSYIRSEIAHSGVMPSLREICRAVGYKSPRSAQLLLERLKEQGLMKGSAGSMTLISKNTSKTIQTTIDVPLVGSVACGTPTLAEQNPEAVVSISTQIAKPGHKYFVLRAHGDSMNKAGINNDDFLLIRQQPFANAGDKVVALIDNEATVKEFQPGENATVLLPRSTNPKNKPIILTEDFNIQGVVVRVLPNFANYG